jgi:pimeloyl-ACP methyl ester carboxylesterase
MAALHAGLVAHEIGPVDLVGMSTGCMIARYVAADRPDLIRRLVLVVAGSRLVAPGRAICQHRQSLAAAARWRRLHGELGTAAVDGKRLP